MAIYDHICRHIYICTTLYTVASYSDIIFESLAIFINIIFNYLTKCFDSECYCVNLYIRIVNTAEVKQPKPTNPLPGLKGRMVGQGSERPALI